MPPPWTTPTADTPTTDHTHSRPTHPQLPPRLLSTGCNAPPRTAHAQHSCRGGNTTAFALLLSFAAPARDSQPLLPSPCTSNTTSWSPHPQPRGHNRLVESKGGKEEKWMGRRALPDRVGSLPRWTETWQCLQLTTLSPPPAVISFPTLFLGLLRRPFCVAACPSFSRCTAVDVTSSGGRCLPYTAHTQQPHTRPINSLMADSKGKSHTELHHTPGHASSG